MTFVAWPSEFLGRIAARWAAAFRARLRDGQPEQVAPVVRTAPRRAEPIDFLALQIWCRSKNRRIAFSLRGDRMMVSPSGLSLAGARPNLLSPWLGLDLTALKGGQPAIRAEHLEALIEGAEPLDACFSVDGGAPVGYAEIAGEVAALVPPDDLVRLVEMGVLSPEEVERAAGQVRPDETLDAALLRLGDVTLSRWIDALAGKPRLVAAAARSFEDRLGMRLLAVRAISQGSLKQALAAQAEEADVRPLGQLLSAPAQAIARAAAGQRPFNVQLPEADMLGETLIRWGCIRRTDWLAAQTAGPDAAARLVGEGKLSRPHLVRAQAYRQNLMRLLAARQVRIGEILVQGGLDRAALTKALAWQVDQPLPLAELMATHRVLAPLEAARALGRQADRYRFLAERSLPELALRPVAVEAAVPPRPPLLSRRALALWALAVASLAYAVSYGARIHGADYGWFDAFFPEPVATPPTFEGPRQAIAQVSRSHPASGPVTVEPLTALNPPGQAIGAKPGRFAGAGAMPTLAPGAIAAGAIGGSRWPAAPGVSGFPSIATRSGAPGSVGVWTGGSPQGGTVASGRYGAVPGSPAGGGVPRTHVALNPGHGPAGAPASDVPGFSGNPGIPGMTGRISGKAGVPQGQRAQDLPSTNAQGTYVGQRQVLAGSVHRSEAVFRAELGVGYFDQGDLAEAAAEFSGAAHDDPTLAAPHYFLAEIAQRTGQQAQAQVEFRRYLALAPDGEYAQAARAGLSGR